MRVSVTGRYNFRASHGLEHRKLGDRCGADRHWHDYTLDVTVTGYIKPVTAGSRTGPSIITAQSYAPDSAGAVIKPERLTYRRDVGMVIDPDDLDAIVTNLIGGWVYGDLDTMTGGRVYTTPELLCGFVIHNLQGKLPEHVELLSVALAVDGNHRVEYRVGE